MSASDTCVPFDRAAFEKTSLDDVQLGDEIAITLGHYDGMFFADDWGWYQGHVVDKRERKVTVGRKWWGGRIQRPYTTIKLRASSPEHAVNRDLIVDDQDDRAYGHGQVLRKIPSSN